MCSALVWTAGGCSHRDLWDDVPGPVAEFLNQYFPYSELQSVTESGSNYHISIDDGPGLTFDYTYSWIAIDGYGMPLPQVLLFDQLRHASTTIFRRPNCLTAYSAWSAIKSIISSPCWTLR